ncbi:serine protease HTRA2, mitochondrial isoform X1 [Formica exsecta]|uniref:serine protease HTRA2, mitochondrial isoform X1 n=1 Tax=Formica exsecta TaxID=72781 RepID=UPI00114359DB|nr:serine protease HTRA2, mitochondrial isoform X1 [Formica exsecta]XP_029675632.1 serine protease HTRA2, mitochondrial isoform X1 [Formica exsecta]XP_029675633.1 serine protease HTRA2, mitochondrial isoform X1 [Formica exsecta]
MAFPLSRLPLTFLARDSSKLSRFATIVLAERYKARIRVFHSHQHQGRRVNDSKSREFLTCTALISAVGLGYVLYNWKDDIWRRIENLAVPNCPVIHAVSLPPSNGNQNRDRYNFIADVVEISAPSVVYIEIKDNRRIDFFTGKPATTSNGSGFIVSQDGLILTNAHVVVNKPNTTVKVRLYDGSTYTGVIEDVDLQSDLATVRIKKTNLPVMKLGCSANIRPGEFVVAIGSPLALSNTITSGVVSSVNRQSQELGLHNPHMGYIQTDAAITFGNSGGPLVNLNGEAIGINAMKVTSGISFAIPIDYAKEFLKKVELRKKDKGNAKYFFTPSQCNVRKISEIILVGVTFQEGPRRRYMGITMQTLMPDTLLEMQQYNEYMHVRHGVLVWKVMLGSPAHNAGLQPGDVVTHANGDPVVDSTNIYKVLEQPGSIKLQVIRKGKILYITVEPEDI